MSKSKVTSVDVIEAKKLTKVQRRVIELRYNDTSKVVHEELVESVSREVSELERGTISDGYLLIGISRAFKVHRTNGNKPILITNPIPRLRNDGNPQRQRAGSSSNLQVTDSGPFIVSDEPKSNSVPSPSPSTEQKHAESPQRVREPETLKTRETSSQRSQEPQQLEDNKKIRGKRKKLCSIL